MTGLTSLGVIEGLITAEVEGEGIGIGRTGINLIEHDHNRPYGN